MICLECEKIIYKTVKYKNNEYVKSFSCNLCNKSFCARHIYSYVDESNSSITNNSQSYCKDCYNTKY